MIYKDDQTRIELIPISRRLPVRIDWARPGTFLVMGNRGVGKSALIQALAERHRHILDVYGSKDNENLCWCRDTSPTDDVLLIHGDNTSVDSSFPTKRVGDLTLDDVESYNVVTTCNSFYSSEKVKYEAIEKAVELLESRDQWNVGDLIFLAMRETMDIIYARMNKGDNEKSAKAQIIYTLRQLRHFGVSSGADMLRWTGIDKEMRDLAEYIVIKQVGWKGLPQDLRFMYSYINPLTFRYMRRNQFAVISSNGNIAMGDFALPKYHKEEGVSLVKELGIRIEHGSEPEQTTTNIVGDREHTVIVDLYRSEGTVRKVRTELPKEDYPKRSISTIGFHLRKHNQEITEKGACYSCTIMKHPHAKEKVSLS